MIFIVRVRTPGSCSVSTEPKNEEHPPHGLPEERRVSEFFPIFRITPVIVMIRLGGRPSGGGGVRPFRAETILKGNGALISFIINNAANVALSKNESREYKW